MNRPYLPLQPEVLLGPQPADQPNLKLASEGVLRYVWNGAFWRDADRGARRCGVRQRQARHVDPGTASPRFTGLALRRAWGGARHRQAGRARRNPHKLIITLSNLFTTPIATGADFAWRDITPVQLLALDQFVLWVNAGSPYQTSKDLMDKLRGGRPDTLKLGGTGSKQEDQLISVLLETAASTRIAYVPLKGGGDVASALAAGQVDMTVNNPIEAEKLWREGALRPLCVFDGQQLDYHAKVSGDRSWSDLPTCMSFGIPVQYQMMRGIFMAPGSTSDQVAYYNQILDKVRRLPEWSEFMARGALKPTNLRGEAFVEWLDRADRFHRVLMREAKLTAPIRGAVPVVGVSPARK